MAEALYNVLRPVKFCQVVGQETAATAVRNGLLKNEFEHSCIFHGQTGGGKTTMARIVGSYLNCLNPSEDGEPCCECANCRALRDGNFPDYVELNAATHGGKDDIDKLIANVSYFPQAGKAKVFVIDEAHCLTISAWKSLLKVLEEPPLHVYFIMCTTNFQAIPPEIQNRCGKYEFSAINESEVYAYLKNISGSSQFSDDALMLVATQARGSMRDAVNNFSHIKMPYPQDYIIQVSDVEKYLNIVTPNTLAAFLKACCQCDMISAFKVISDSEDSAMDVTRLMSAILSTASTMITRLAGGRLPAGVAEVDVSGIELNRIVVVSNKLNEVYSRVSTRNYAAMRLAVASVCGIDAGSSMKTDTSLLDTLLARIATLEKTVKSFVPEADKQHVDEVSEDKKQCAEFIGNDTSYDACMQTISTSTVAAEIKEVGDGNPIMAVFGVFDTAEEAVGAEIADECGKDTPVNNPVMDNGDVVGGIVFNNVSLANEFKAASSKGIKADKALDFACKDDAVLNILVSRLCDKKITSGGVTLATPFETVKDLIIAQLSYHKVLGVTVVWINGLRI